MDYHNVIEIHYNWHVHPEHGSDFGFYRVGESFSRFPSGVYRCENIEIVFEEGMHAVMYFANGDVEHQWNVNKIIEAEHNVYNQAKKHQGNQETTQLPQSNIDKAQDKK